MYVYVYVNVNVHHILGKIHNLIHADDIVILDTNMNNMKLKIAATIEFFQSIKQNINSGKTKYIIIGNNSNKLKSELCINKIKISYSTKEKYLGHYITDDNSMRKSIELDIGERGTNVIIKYRYFVNNDPCTKLAICLGVFQACFCTTILSNCATWGSWIPRKVLTLYNLGLKLALGVRSNTPTVSPRRLNRHMMFFRTRSEVGPSIPWKQASPSSRYKPKLSTPSWSPKRWRMYKPTNSHISAPSKLPMVTSKELSPEFFIQTAFFSKQ